MRLTSQNIKNLETIPSVYTCDGKGVSPHLAWIEAPYGTRSFVLLVHDPDAPSGDFIHWLVINIPAEIREVSENSSPEGGEEITNDFGKAAYGGPCPPSGQHRYFFELYALDVPELKEVTKENFQNKIKKHVLASSELVGFY